MDLRLLRSLELRHFRTRRPNSIDFYLTNKCDRLCPFCPVNTNSGEPKEDLPLDVMERAITKLTKIFPTIRRIRFSGGEPTTCPTFVKACELCFSHGIEDLALFTNATNLAVLTETGLIEHFRDIHVSLHSIASFEQLFGLKDKDVRERVLSSLIELPPRYRKRITLSIGLTHWNRDFSDVLDFARQYGMGGATVFPIRADFDQIYRGFRPFPNEYIDRSALDLVSRYPDVVKTPCKHTLEKELAVQEGRYKWQGPCYMPCTYVGVMQNGIVRRCMGNQPPIGHIDSFEETCPAVQRIFSEAEHRTGICQNCLLGVEICSRCDVVSYVKRKAVGWLRKVSGWQLVDRVEEGGD